MAADRHFENTETAIIRPPTVRLSRRNPKIKIEFVMGQNQTFIPLSFLIFTPRYAFSMSRSERHSVLLAVKPKCNFSGFQTGNVNVNETRQGETLTLRKEDFK